MSLPKPYSIIRVRKNIQSQRNKQKELIKDLAYSTNFKLSLHSNLNPEKSEFLTARTQLMVNAQKINVPDLIITSGRNHFNARPNSFRGKAVTLNKGQMTHFENTRYLNETKQNFRVKNVSYLLSPMKNSISSMLTPKTKPSEFKSPKSVQIYQKSKNNPIDEIHYNSTKLNQTKSIKRLRDERCLIVTTKKLPFCLERKNTKRKFTEKTNFTSTGQDLFEVDISTIMDEHEPDTPFMRPNSGFEQIINITSINGVYK